MTSLKEVNKIIPISQGFLHLHSQSATWQLSDEQQPFSQAQSGHPERAKSQPIAKNTETNKTFIFILRLFFAGLEFWDK